MQTPTQPRHCKAKWKGEHSLLQHSRTTPTDCGNILEMLCRTLALIKPDGLTYMGEILTAITDAGLTIRREIWL